MSCHVMFMSAHNITATRPVAPDPGHCSWRLTDELPVAGGQVLADAADKPALQLTLIQQPLLHHMASSSSSSSSTVGGRSLQCKALSVLPPSASGQQTRVDPPQGRCHHHPQTGPINTHTRRLWLPARYTLTYSSPPCMPAGEMNKRASSWMELHLCRIYYCTSAQLPLSCICCMLHLMSHLQAGVSHA
jgi:hypothetical protein